MSLRRTRRTRAQLNALLRHYNQEIVIPPEVIKYIISRLTNIRLNYNYHNGGGGSGIRSGVLVN